MSVIQTASLLTVALYLVAFFAFSTLAAKAAGHSVWLFAGARGRDRLAAIGFRASFALTLCGPLVYATVPTLFALDPLWNPNLKWLALPGHLIAIAGAMLAFSAQIAMGVSWRVGVRADATGDLISEGLYTLSRNPAFLGQAALLTGVALSVPSLPGLISVLLFLSSAMMQIRSEEAILLQKHGDAFKSFCARTPRWIGRPRRYSEK